MHPETTPARSRRANRGDTLERSIGLYRVSRVGVYFFVYCQTRRRVEMAADRQV